MDKILHISKYYYPYVGGTEQMARDSVLALMGKYEQKVIAFSNDKHDQTIEVDGVEVIKCGCFTTIASQSLSLSYRRKLNKVINDYEPDIVVFHYPNPFVAALLLPKLGKKTKLLLYWHLDITKQRVLGKFFVKQNEQLLKRADVVVATSPNYIEGSPWLKRYRNKCCVIPNCFNQKRMEITQDVKKRAEQIKAEHQGKVLCLAVGRHTEYKGFKYLVQASHLIDDTCDFIIAGTGEQTRALRKASIKDKKISFPGRVDDNELKALLYACDIFCFSSITKNEAFGLALVEAMFYSKPSVTFTIEGSGVNYVSINCETGIEVDNRDVVSYAEAIKKLAEHKELREKYGENAKLRVMENFTFEKYKSNLNALINKLADMP